MSNRKGTSMIMVDRLQDLNSRQNQSLTISEINNDRNPIKNLSQLYIPQTQTVMPISMVEFSGDTNGYMLPVTGYLSQQGSGKIEEFSSSCVPLIPLSSVLVPVDDVSSGDAGIGYGIPSTYETYSCLPSSNQPVHKVSDLPTNIRSGIADSVLMVDGEASMICRVNSSAVQNPSVSFVPSEATALIGHYPTITASESATPISASTSAVTLNSVKKKGRPRKPTIVVDPERTRQITVNPESQSYNPSHFWCPICQISYTVSECPHHPLSIESDSPVPTYAKSSLPAGLSLEPGSENFRVICKRRLPPCTRFGPVVAPLVTEAELQLHPDWLSSCPFRVDPVDPSKPVQYLKMSDESVCNWMMFVRREDQCDAKDSASARCRQPNCVAYQFGSAGVFFVTTKAIRPGEELLVTLAPPYATRSHSAIVCQLESCYIDKTNVFPSQPKRDTVADEIHCFRCAITFDSEEAFRVHCLGHPDEFALRGFIDTEEVGAGKPLSIYQPENLQTQSDPAYIRVRKPTIKDITDTTAHTNNESRTVYFRSALQCTLCFNTFQGLSQLIQHTNTAHSVAAPRIFKRSTCPAQLLSPVYVGDATDEIVASNDLDAERLIVKSGSLYDFRGTDPTSVSSAENLLVVDLTNASQNLLEQTFWAYGCGQCKQRFPSMLALEQHKETLHDTTNPVNTVVSQQFQLDELLPQTYTQSISVVSTGTGGAQFSSFDIDTRQTTHASKEMLFCNWVFLFCPSYG